MHKYKTVTFSHIATTPIAQKLLTETTPIPSGLPILNNPNATDEIAMLLAQTELLHCSVCLL